MDKNYDTLIVNGDEPKYPKYITLSNGTTHELERLIARAVMVDMQFN